MFPAAGGATLPTVDTEAAPNDGDEQPAPTTSDPQPMPPFTLFGGARVRFHGLKKADYLNGALGFCMLPPADPNDRIRVLIASNGGIALVKRENLQRNECVALPPKRCLRSARPSLRAYSGRLPTVFLSETNGMARMRWT